MDQTAVTGLAGEYKRLCGELSDIVGHLPRFVEFCEVLQARHVVELGTRSGVSTVAWLYGLERTGGRLTSIDLDVRPDIGEYPHWTFIQGDDLDPAVIGGLEMADIVFIDTSHFYDQTVRELNVYRWLVRSGGIMVLHDTELPIPEGAPPRPLYPVKTAVTEFCEGNGFEWTNFEDSWGLAVVRIP